MRRITTEQWWGGVFVALVLVTLVAAVFVLGRGDGDGSIPTAITLPDDQAGASTTTFPTSSSVVATVTLASSTSSSTSSTSSTTVVAQATTTSRQVTTTEQTTTTTTTEATTTSEETTTTTEEETTTTTEEETTTTTEEETTTTTEEEQVLASPIVNARYVDEDGSVSLTIVYPADAPQPIRMAISRDGRSLTTVQWPDGVGSLEVVDPNPEPGADHFYCAAPRRAGFDSPGCVGADVVTIPAPNDGDR